MTFVIIYETYDKKIVLFFWLIVIWSKDFSVLILTRV